MNQLAGVPAGRGRGTSQNDELAISRNIAKPAIVEEQVEKRTEQLEHGAEEREESILESMLESVPGLFYVFDNKGRYLRWNKTVEKVSGYSRSEIKRMSPLDFFAEEEKTRVAEKIGEVFKKGGATVEANFVSKDGRKTPYFFTGLQVTLDNKPCIVGVGIDITERKQMEEELRRSREEMDFILTSGPAVIFTGRPHGGYADFVTIYISSNVTSIVGHEPREFIDDPAFWRAHVHPDDLANVLEGLPRLFKEGHFGVDYRFLHKDGTYRWLHEEERIVMDPTGQTSEIIGYWIDVTERRKFAEALEDSETQLRLLLDSTGEGIFGLDVHGKCIFCNPACVRHLGYKRVADLVGKNLHDFIRHTRPDGDHAVDECRIFKAFREGKSTHFDDELFWRSDGTSFPAEYWSYPEMKGDTIVGAVVTFADITERRQAEEDIKTLNRQMAGRLMQKIGQMDNLAKVRETVRQTSDVTAGLDLILNACLQDLEMEVGAVFLIDREENTVNLRNFKSKLESIKIADSYPLGNNFAEFDPIRANKRMSKIILQSEESILGTASIHSFPIYIGRKMAGVIVFGSEKNSTIEDSDLAVLGLYAGITSTLFEVQNLSVTPAKEAIRGTRTVELEFGESYLVKNDVGKAFDVFTDNVLSGLPGLCITREYPPKIRKRYGLEKTPIFWLTQEPSKDKTIVHSIQEVSILINDFLGKAQHAVVLFDGFEYLITNHGFDLFIRFLQLTRSRFAQNEAILIAPVLEKALDETQARLIERETRPLTTELRPASISQNAR